MTANRLLLEDDEREALWAALVAEVETYLRDVPSLRVTPDIGVAREGRSSACLA